MKWSECEWNKYHVMHIRWYFVFLFAFFALSLTFFFQLCYAPHFACYITIVHHIHYKIHLGVKIHLVSISILLLLLLLLLLPCAFLCEQMFKIFLSFNPLLTHSRCRHHHHHHQLFHILWTLFEWNMHVHYFKDKSFCLFCSFYF